MMRVSSRRNALFRFLLLTMATASTISDAFSIPLFRIPAGGGRVPSQPDVISTQQSPCTAIVSDPTSPSQCRLIICQITDVYTLEHLASFKAMVEDIRRNAPDAKVISMLTGDFLSPYLLSSVDRGAGMMNALNKIPLDYLTWGNHEADIDHKDVCNHVRNFQGTFLNSNMLDHEAMESQQEYDVIELTSSNGKQTRKVGLCAVLSNDPDLYSHFPAPGAFGGAHISDPWQALTKYQDILETKENCDVVIPLQHLYVPDDHKTCQEFDFPLILSGHDHHRVDEVIEGTRLIKPGMNAIHAAVVEVSWDDDTCETPRVSSKFARCSDWVPDEVLEEENERAYDALAPLRNTELASIPPEFFPLSSGNARGEVCTMGKYICTLIKTAMNSERPNDRVDAVLLMGGNIRGNVHEYPEDSFFSLETLQQEIKPDETLAVVPMPGWLLSEGVAATHAGEPIPGWMQYDDGIQQEATEDGSLRVTHVNNQPIEPGRIYRVATKVSDLTNGQCPPWEQYYILLPECLPPKGSYINIQSELMTHFARSLWRQLWDAVTDELLEGEDDLDCATDDCHAERLQVLDTTGDGEVTVEEIQQALQTHLDLSVDEDETTLAEMVHSIADHNGSGRVTVKDFEAYCEQLAEDPETADLSMDQWKALYEQATQVFDLDLFTDGDEKEEEKETVDTR